ncbi:MAG: Holliday junction resolvase RuvX [Tissierellia bacterium]|nr:Holliday junction resolvase RuvX [Tissierellia bacterium]
MNKILGLDIGDRWIGVAISDKTQMIAQPLTTIKRQSNKQAYEDIHKIMKDEKIEKVVVGLPKNMNNTLGPQSEKVKKFADKLGNKYRVQIIYVDERMTTLMAEQDLIKGSVRRENRKKYIDKIAAAYILRTYLDRLPEERREVNGESTFLR